MFADANTSALAPPAISSFNSPDAPNFACTLKGTDFSNAWLTSASAPRRLPAACSRTVSDAAAGDMSKPVIVAINANTFFSTVTPPIRIRGGCCNRYLALLQP
jgi:hypothetical protein